MKKFWGSKVQYGDYGYQRCVVYVEVAKRVELRSSHHTQKVKDTN